MCLLVILRTANPQHQQGRELVGDPAQPTRNTNKGGSLLVILRTANPQHQQGRGSI